MQCSGRMVVVAVVDAVLVEVGPERRSSSCLVGHVIASVSVLRSAFLHPL